MAATVACDSTYCSIHSKKCQYYCYECERLICFLCLNSGEHKFHNFDQLSATFYAQLQARFLQLVHDIQELEATTEDKVLLTEDQDKAANKGFRLTCNDIEIFFQLVSKVVDAKERDLKDSLAKEKIRRTQRLQKLKRDYEDIEKQCRQCKRSADEGSLSTRLRAKEKSSVADSFRVMDKVAEVATKMQSFLSVPLPSNDDLEVVDIDFNADEAIVEIAVSTLGQLTQGPAVSKPDVNVPTFPEPFTVPNTGVIDSFDSDDSTYTIPEGKGARNSSGKKELSSLSVIKGIIKPPDSIITYTADDGFQFEPSGVCCTRNNGIAVSNGTSSCLQVFNLNGELLRTIRRKLKSRMNLAYYSTKHKLVCVDCDEDGKCQLIKIKGNITLEMETYELSGLSNPGGVTVGIDERKQPALYVTDTTQSVIYKLDTHGNNLQRLVDNDGMLAKPMGIVYTHGCVIVCDHGNNSVVKLSTDDGRIQWKADQLVQPFDVAIDHQGYAYVTESGSHRVSVFNHKGKFVTHFGRKGSTPGMFDTPRGITVTEDNSKLVVADSGNNRLQVFSRDLILNDI